MSSVNTQKNESENPETQPVITTPEETGSVTASEPHEHTHEHTHEETQAEAQPPFDTRCVREINVEIPAEVVSKQWDTIVQRYSKVARVPGFRHGKVPPSIIRTRFADDIKKEVFEALVPQHFREAVQKEGFRPITEPRLLDLQMEPGSPLRFRAAFEVLPDIELGSYDDIKFDKPDVSVSDEDVEADLKALQERQASYDPVNEERALSDGDFAQISFKAVPKQEASPEQPPAEGEQSSPAQPDEAQPVQMDEVLVEIGAANTIPEFSEHLRGAKPGEERTFDVSYPAEYSEPRLAGKTFTYTATVNAIKKKTAPELNDEFARELSQEFQTLDDLKKRMREGLEAERQRDVSQELKHKLLDKLIERHDFPVPEILVQHEVDNRLERGLRALAAQGMRTEDMKRMDFRRLRAGQRDFAIKQVKSDLLLAKIAEAENIDVGDDEIHREVQLLAQQMKQTPEALYQKYSEDGTLNEIKSRMRVAKTLDFLYNKSIGEEQSEKVGQQ